jgi:hypothetical protein
MKKTVSPNWFTLGLIMIVLAIAIKVLVKKPIPSLASQTSSRQDSHADVHEPDAEAPRLRLECRNDNDCIRISEIDWNDGQGALHRKFLRILVYNDNPGTTAEGCKVTLRSLTEITPIGVLRTEYNTPGLLIWSGDDAAKEEGRSIPHNVHPVIIDLFYTVNMPSGDQVYLKDHKNNLFLKYNKSYKFEIVATAENAKPIVKEIKVRFGQAWQDFDVLAH